MNSREKSSRKKQEQAWWTEGKGGEGASGGVTRLDSLEARKAEELHRQSAAEAIVSDVHHLQIPEMRDVSSGFCAVRKHVERLAWLTREQVVLQKH